MRVWILILALLLPSLGRTNTVLEVPELYRPLMERLSADGVSSEFLSMLFRDRRAEAIPKRMAISLDSKEKEEIYLPFLTPESLQLAKNFLREHLPLLEDTESRYRVDKEVIVAILLVESRCGENIGKHRVVPTLASMAIMDNPDNLQRNYLLLRDLDPELTFEWVEERARRRANWAYQELKSFLTIVGNEKTDPLEIMGSHAGALGMAQFIPSSYLAFAVSQKGLGHWVSSREEAILSIANYLNLHGWKKGITLEKKRKVLWCYNRSEPYITTVLKVADRIKKK